MPSKKPNNQSRARLLSGAMARARCCISVVEPGKDEFVYTFYCIAPAFFLARNPTHEEKLAFAGQLTTTYNHRALQMKAFACIACKRPAHQSIDWLTYALSDPGCMAVNNTILPVCQAAACARKAQRALDSYRKTQALHQGSVAMGPEIISCRTCFRDHSDKLPLQACSRCNATLYCSPECQKIGWKLHKQQCTGRVEAAKLTAEQLRQLDTLLRLRTGGTMELPQCNHPGKLPPAHTQAGIGDMLECGQETAIARIAKSAKLAKKEMKKTADLRSIPAALAVTPEQQLQLEGVRSDIFKYFGLLTQTNQVAVPSSGFA